MKYAFISVVFITLLSITQLLWDKNKEQKEFFSLQISELRTVISYYNNFLSEKEEIKLFNSPIKEEDFKDYSSPFGIRNNPLQKNIGGDNTKYHSGLDITGVFEARVIAIADGIVVNKYFSKGYHGGKYYRGHPDFDGYIEILHENGFVSRYGHLGDIYVKEGDKVFSGEVIARINQKVVGKSTGPHLHFALTDETSEFVQPFKYLNLP